MPMLSQATKTKQNKSKQKNSKMSCVKRNAESQPVWFEADNLLHCIQITKKKMSQKPEIW